MISSRWPRPTFVIESIALIPVWSGSFTGWRWTTPGALHSSGRRSVDVDRALPVERVAERVDDAAEQALADRHRGDLAGAPHRVALLDLVPLAEERDADVVLLEVEREADDAVVELEHLERDAVLEPVDARDAVAELQHGADLGEVRLDVELLDPLAQDRRDLFGRSFIRSNSLSLRARWRSRSSRPRTLASSLIDPAWRTMPPIRSGSTVRVACTSRPDAFSIWPRMPSNSSSDSSCAVVSSTSSTCCSRGDERLELGGDLADLAGAPLLGEQAHEVADELVRRRRARARARRPSRRESVSGLTSSADELGHVVERADEIARARTRTTSRRPLSCAASKSARA